MSQPLVEAIERKDRDLGAQLRRSLNSIALNVAEAFGVHAGNARLSFRRALGELYESQATLQVAAAWGTITEQQAGAVASELAALGGRLYGLSRRWRVGLATGPSHWLTRGGFERLGQVFWGALG